MCVPEKERKGRKVKKLFTNEILSDSGKFDKRYTIRFVFRVVFVILMFISLASCMSLPVDQQHLKSIAPGVYVPFMGAVVSPNTVINIEALNPANGGKWEKIGQATSNNNPYSRFSTDWYVFSIYPGLQIPKKYWEPAPASIEYMANVRATLGGDSSTQLISMKGVPVVCFAQNIGSLSDFLTKCKSDSSPRATVYARRDWHQDCVDMINNIRDKENVPRLQRYKGKEECSDKAAKINFETGVPHESWCGEGKNDPTPDGIGGQNECYVRPTLDQTLTDCIRDSMYLFEKQCKQKNDCNGNINQDCQCGHYEKMVDTAFKKVSCGIYVTPNKKFKALMNFWYY